MEKNIGKSDRIVRAVLGLAFLGLGWWFKSLILVGVALFCFYQAFASWCFYFWLIGKNTCPLKD